jgi:thiamine pyrophosphate-dependent acetolactate synthase large subunit-like protein
MKQLQTVSVAGQILEGLARHGAKTFFNLPGGTSIPWHLGLLEVPLRSVPVRHEQAAVLAAYGEAFVSGKPSLACVIAGPGVLNAMTALATAQVDGMPVVLLSTVPPLRAAGLSVAQDASVYGLNIAAATRSIGVETIEILSPAAVPQLMGRALRHLRKGPVHLIVPTDVLGQHKVEFALEDWWPLSTTPRAVDDTALQQLAQMLSTACRPVLCIGGGARAANISRAWLADFSRRHGFAMVATPKAKDMLWLTNPLAAGVAGQFGSDEANAVMRAADLLVVLGSTLGESATDNFRALPSTCQLVQIDRDETVIGRNLAPVSLGVVGDVKVCLERLDRLLRECEVRARATHWNFERVEAELPRVAEGIHPLATLRALERTLPEHATVVVDIGNIMCFAHANLRLHTTQRFVSGLGLGAMSFSLTTIGIACHERTERVVCLLGDGALLQIAGDLHTIAEERLDNISLVTFNDQAWGMVLAGIENRFGASASAIARSQFNTRFEAAAAARALGFVHTYVIECEADLDTTLQKALRVPGPSLVEVKTAHTVPDVIARRNQALFGKNE